MVKKIKIFADLHKYGTCDLGIELQYGNDCYYLGDNYDLAHCNRAQIRQALEELEIARSRFDGRFVRGNHELNLIDAPDFITVGDSVLCHGDQIFWSQNHVETWRSQVPGMGTLRRILTEGTVDFMRYLLPRPTLSEDQESRVIWIASRFGKKRIICAHRHPATVWKYRIGDIELIVLPRGISEIEVKNETSMENCPRGFI